MGTQGALKILVGSLCCGLVLLGFQNCSEVSFQDAQNLAQKGGHSVPVLDTDDLDGEPVDQDVEEEIENRINTHNENEDNHNDDGGDDNVDSSHQDEPNHNEENDQPASNIVYTDAAECQNGESNQVKVFVCHLPNGQPEKAKTLCISTHALKAHAGKGHGDHVDLVGRCEDVL